MEWIVDAEGCLAASLCDLARLREICERAVVELRLKVVGEPLWHQFPGTGGLTGMYLLSESHLTCHSFPEHGTVTFNLFCCSTRPEWNWAEVLSAELDAARVHVRSVSRKICAEHAAAKVHP